MPLMDHSEINDLVKIPELVEHLNWIACYLEECKEVTYAKYIRIAIHKLQQGNQCNAT